MLKFYFHPSPNPLKVALLLEEGKISYEAVPVDTFKGEQHHTVFTKLNPNAKLPVIVDGDAVVFDSNAILLYLAQRSQQWLGSPSEQGSVLSWLMFVATGLSPFSGQAVHFLHHAPEKLAYPQNRYLKEVRRHYSVMNDRLARNQYLAGSNYTIADMAAWGWMSFAHYILGENGLADYPHVKRLFDEINTRPAAKRVHELKTRFTFKADFDEETRRALFRSTLE
jgi:GSH-dependent disulfide-bond oxidoreductase